MARLKNINKELYISRSSKIQGSGLGLAIYKKLLNLMVEKYGVNVRII